MYKNDISYVKVNYESINIKNLTFTFKTKLLSFYVNKFFKKNRVLFLFVFFIILSLSYSCTNIPTSTETNKEKNTEISKKIIGKAVFPETRKETYNFKTKSNTSDVSKVSTISVILPHDEAINKNTTIATGVTDSNGNFLIDMTKIKLIADSIYVLEASKRSEIDNIMTIRTFIKWNGKEWSSISKSSEILIDHNTTALSAISNFTHTQSYKLLLTLPVENGITKEEKIPDSEITKEDINHVGLLVISILQGGMDPIALLRYDPKQSYKYYIDQTYNYINLATYNKCVGCSFFGNNIKNSGMNFAGKDLSYSDLSNQDLSNADLSGTILVGANLVGTKLPKDLSYLNLSYTDLKGQDFTDSNITGTNFSYANLENCILSKESSPKDLTKARFTGSNFKNASLASANLSKVYLFEASFKNTNIRKANFYESDMTGVDLSDVQGKDFYGVNFKNTTLIGSSFKGVDLTNIDLISAKVEGSDFSKTIIKNKIPNANLQNCNFSEATIKNINSYNLGKTLNLSNSNFNKAVISDSTLWYTSCENCNFSESTLHFVRFYYSNLKSSSFENIKDMKNYKRNETSEAIELIISSSDLIKTNFSNINTKYTIIIDSNDISYADISNSNMPNIHFMVKDASYTKFDNSTINGIYFYNNKDKDFKEIKNNNPYFTSKYIIPFDYSTLLKRVNVSGFDKFLNRSDIRFQIFESHARYGDAKDIYDWTKNMKKLSDTEVNEISAMYDNPPQNVIKGVSFKNTKMNYFTSTYSYHYGLNGSSFENSDFTNINNNRQIMEFNGYFKNCNFKNANIRLGDVISINNIFDKSKFYVIGHSYFKNTDINVFSTGVSLFISSQIRFYNNKYPLGFFIKNSTIIDSNEIQCKNQWAGNVYALHYGYANENTYYKIGVAQVESSFIYCTRFYDNLSMLPNGSLHSLIM